MSEDIVLSMEYDVLARLALLEIKRELRRHSEPVPVAHGDDAKQHTEGAIGMAPAILFGISLFGARLVSTRWSK